jgi:hypothetical protein
MVLTPVGRFTLNVPIHSPGETLFVGNQEEHPTGFLVLGVFWPPAGTYQALFDL